MKRYVLSASLLGALLLSLLGVRPALAEQVTPPQYFPETAHSVRSPFIDYFLSTGGLTQYGYPITDDYVDPATGLLIQYFEKTRMEWHPGNPEPYKVQLGLLGSELGKSQAPIPIASMAAPGDPSCQNFLETGHTLCFDFRTFWQANGGLDRFGYPISQITIENDYLVQYFQRARLEWHPEKPAGQQMTTAALGLIYYRWAKLDESRLVGGNRSASLNPLLPPTSIQARASVFTPSPAVGDTQVVFINVTNQLNAPLGGAAVTLIVHYPGHDETFQMPPTSASGTTFQTFKVPLTPAGTLVAMEFIITHSGVFGATRTSFMIWY
jgi:hypothetical protein